jgi:hypothetical protein
MTNRLKPLLATYYGSAHSIEKIAFERIEASAEYERMCKQLDGPEFVRKWRTAEMRIVLTKERLTSLDITHCELKKRYYSLRSSFWNGLLLRKDSLSFIRVAIVANSFAISQKHC